MKMLIIDAANKEINLMIINNDITYSITHENSKINYDRLTVLIYNFLNSKNLKLGDINKIYVNRGPGSFAGIRNSLSAVKAFNLAKKIEYYCYSYVDFKDEIEIKPANIPKLCDKFNVKKNLIKPIYLS